MADQMTAAEKAAVADRICDVPDTPPDPPFRPETIAADRLLTLARAGDTGAVRRFVHDLEYSAGAWQVDPWRLIEAIADAAGSLLSDE